MAITRDLPFHLENKVKFTDLTAAINQPLYQSNLVHTDFPPSAVYSPLPYLVAASGILVGKALGASPLIIFLPRTRLQFVGVELHRLQNAAIDPGVQMDVFSAFLSPMSINQAISYSADSLTNALSFFALGYCLYLTFPADNVNLKKLLPLFALAILLPLTRPPYAALTGLVLLIPARKFGTLKRYLLVILALAAICGILIWIGSSINREYYYRFVPIQG